MADRDVTDAARRALAEDRATEDVTTRLVPDPGRRMRLLFIAEERMVPAGLEVASAVMRVLDPGAGFAACVGAGAWVLPGDTICIASAAASTLLAGERVALNFLQRLSGVATATRRAVDAVAGTAARITHTRKTTPGLRALELEAVRLGGGVPNRASLADAVMWKDNHWAMLPHPGALKGALAQAPRGIDLVVEVENEAQLEAALEAGARHLLVDNQSPSRLSEWARRAGPGITIQASGGITLDNAREYALAGAHLIAIGALTHSARAAAVRCDLQEGP